MIWRAIILCVSFSGLLLAEPSRVVEPGFEVRWQLQPPAALKDSFLRALSWDERHGVALSDESTHRLLRWDPIAEQFERLAGGPSHGDRNGLPLSARFALPQGLASDSDRVLVADTGNHKIRAFAWEGNVSTVAGNGEPGFRDGPAVQAQFASPAGVSIALDKTIYVADTFNHAIRTITPQGEVGTLAGGSQMGLADGEGTKALFAGPSSVAIGPGGRLYVADTFNHAIRVIEPSGRVWTLAGNGTSGYQDGREALFNHPLAVTWHPDGFLLVADSLNHAIRVVTPDGVVRTASGGLGSGNRLGSAHRSRFEEPSDLTVDSLGRILIVDAGNRVLKLMEYTPLAP